MKIEIENTSSPGASFTANTNSVLLKTYEWILENKGTVLPFYDFRMRLQNEKGINDNNNRNIYPLLKNGGMADYEKGKMLNVDYFYTNTGLAYVKTLESIVVLETEDYTKEQKDNARKRFELIQNEIIFNALTKITSQPDVNYVKPFKDLVGFLLKFGRITKVEFAYLLFELQKYNTQDALDSMADNVAMYRNGTLEIEVGVKVRNDIKIREKTNSEKRKEGVSFLTSYTYFISLLQQAGLVKKADKYFYVVEEKRHLLEKLGE